MAVYTHLSEEDIRELLARYSLPPLAMAEGIRSGVENTNYKLTLQNEVKLILTVFEQRVTMADLPFFCGLMQQLSSRGVPCPTPIAASDGQAIHLMKQKPAMLVSFLEGASADHITPLHTQALGVALAKLHLAAEGFPISRKNALDLAGWRDLLALISPRAHEITPALPNILNAEIEFLTKTWPDNLQRGVIHADLFPDNVFFNGKALLTGLIDFYFACNDILAYDLAICLNAWCLDKDGTLNKACAQTLYNGYNSVRPIPVEELEAVPILARGAATRFLLTRVQHKLFSTGEGLVTPHDPMEYVHKLQTHHTLPHYSNYGITL